MLSVALIVKDEEKNLRRCLTSLQGLWDQLVIVDTGSKDKTVEIAKEFTNDIHYFEWIKDFSAARNFSFSKCNEPWIMWVDADDMLRPEDVKIIKERLPGVADNIDFVLMNYHYYLNDKGEPAATQLRERIIRNGRGIWQGRCHESIFVNFTKSTTLDAAVWHHRDLADMTADRSRNIEIMKVEVKENPCGRSYYYYAQELADHGLHVDAVVNYQKAYELYTSPDDKFQAAYRIGLSQKILSKFDSAIEWFNRSLQHHMSYREPIIEMAWIYMQKLEYDKASKWLELSLHIDEPKHPFMIVRKEYYTWAPYEYLAKAYFGIKNYDKALAASEELYKLTKNPNVLRDIMVIKEVKKSLYKRPTGAIRLNLGCGSKPMPNFTNCDLFPGPGVDEVFSLDEIPYADETVDEISSEHALEHLPRLKAESAIAEWARVLKSGGKLTLKIPDVEICCQKFVSDPANRENWWLFTLYGIQDFRNEPNAPFKDKVNYGQIHYTGFTKDSIKKLLVKNGFVVQEISNYDGWDTPSICVKACKAQISNLAIYMPYQFDPANPSVRLRRLLIQDVLTKNGFDCEITGSFDKLMRFDNILFSHLTENVISEIQQLKRHGKRILFDHSEALFGLPYQKEIFEACDVIICCSTKLAEMTKQYFPKTNTYVIHDLYEVPA